MPNVSSETYRSMFALLDRRVDLDPTIQPGHLNYEASLSWMAAKLSYENSAFIQTIVQDHWKVLSSFHLIFFNWIIKSFICCTVLVRI